MVLGRITPKSYEQLGIPDREKPMPDINTDPTSSNIYGVSERILLTWLNYCYSNYREEVWVHRDQCKNQIDFSLLQMIIDIKLYFSKYAFWPMDCQFRYRSCR